MNGLDQEAVDRLGIDSGVIQIMLIETSTQYLIDTARIKSRGGLLTFHDNKPEDLIGPPLEQYARSLLGLERPGNSRGERHEWPAKSQ